MMKSVQKIDNCQYQCLRAVKMLKNQRPKQILEWTIGARFG